MKFRWDRLVSGALAGAPPGAAGAGTADATAPTARNIDNPATSATGLVISLDRRSVLVIKLSRFAFLGDRRAPLPAHSRQVCAKSVLSRTASVPPIYATGLRHEPMRLVVVMAGKRE